MFCRFIYDNKAEFNSKSDESVSSEEHAPRNNKKVVIINNNLFIANSLFIYYSKLSTAYCASSAVNCSPYSEVNWLNNSASDIGMISK